jgi:hypothetical protein
VVVERCPQCGFDGEEWTDQSATDAIGSLPARWRDAAAALTPHDLQRRPIADMWSIAEYVDHVREVLFGMRFVLDTAIAQPGTDLGEAPEPRFEPEPRVIDISLALSGVDREAKALRERLSDLPDSGWTSTAVVGGDEIDARWIARHAVHDATHHLRDAERLRAAL